MRYFVSYTTRGNEITAELLKVLSYRLRVFGDVFIDLIDNDSSDKQSRIIFELDRSDELILIESKLTYLSKWVSIELKRARERNIPVRRISVETLTSMMLTENFTWQVSLGNSPSNDQEILPLSHD